MQGLITSWSLGGGSCTAVREKILRCRFLVYPRRPISQKWLYLQNPIWKDSMSNRITMVTTARLVIRTWPLPATTYIQRNKEETTDRDPTRRGERWQPVTT